MRFVFSIAFICVSYCGFSQSQTNLDSLLAPSGTENVYNSVIASDSLTSSFIIVIKKEVKKHKHAFHSEHVYVLEGEGDMVLGDKNIHIKKGDLIFIPKNTPHALKVTSLIPVKVLSVQAPFFDGKDRILIE